MRDPAVYEAWYDSPRGRWIGEIEFALLQGLLDAKPGESLLDVGCGTGWFTRRFATQGLITTGLDPNADWLAFARARGGEENYIEGDARTLPFPDASFDRVVSVTALCFVKDWPRALSEIVRVTRRRFALGLLNRDSLLYRQKGCHGGSGAYRGAHWHMRDEVRAALANLPVANARFRSAIFLPSGSFFARAAESVLPQSLPFGGFLAVAGEVSRPRQ